VSGPIAIVGGGVTGLAAAHELAAASPAVDFDLLEAGPHVGGKVGGGPVGPMVVDTGADGFLAREPEMSELCRELGLGDDLVSPRFTRAFMWSRGELRGIPRPSVLGVPLDPDALAESGIVSAAGLGEHRLRADRLHAPLDGDAGIGAVLRPRVGDEVFERLIDPLLGGINAGNADEISIEAGAAALAAAARDGGSLIAALRARTVCTDRPVFHGIRGGSERIIATLAGSLSAHLSVGSAALAIERRGTDWEVRTPTGPLRARAVILATPAPVTAALVRPFAPGAASTLDSIELADVALVTFVYRRRAVGRELDASGFLVPRSEGLLMTACSWSSSKWEHYDDGEHVVLRVSAGRTDDTRWIDLGDAELVMHLRTELAETMGVDESPIAVRVTRWLGSLPQYRPGHLDRIAAVEEELAAEMPGVLATGAAFRGLGLPACVRQGRDTARAALCVVG
jgi:oxygen-dependent protoporphyrinogen oxidase